MLNANLIDDEEERPSWQSDSAGQGRPTLLRKCGMIKTQHISNGGKSPMANVVKKHSLSSELAQKMVNAAVAKTRELGVTENVAILGDGGNLKAFSRMDGTPIPTIEMAQNKAYTALLGVSKQDSFNFIQGDPSLLAGIPTLARVWPRGVEGFPSRWMGNCRCGRRERSAHRAERCRLRETGPSGRIR
jgi:uncharacterized protein GlcG (DUF336 family)